MRWARRIVVTVAALGAVLAVTAILGSRMGLFAGSRPADLGFANGAFAPGDWRPNWVSSTVPASDAKHYIAPLAFEGDAPRAWSALEAAVAAMPRATVVTRSAGYLHVECASAGMGFVDDLQLALDPGAGAIHVRSGARLGVRDFSVNRERVERLRKALAGAAPPRPPGG